MYEGNLTENREEIMRFFKSCLWVLLFLSVCSFSVAEENRETINQQAITAYQQGDYKKATVLTRQALEIAKIQYGEKDSNTLKSMNNLAESYKAQGQYEQAESLHKQVLDLRRQVLGRRHPATLFSMINLARIYTLKGEYQLAETLYKQTLTLRKQTLGEKHIDTFISINNLASLYLIQGQYQLAEPLYQQSLLLSKQVLGKNHPNTVIFMNNIASLYQAQGQYKQAEIIYQKILRLVKEILDNEDSAKLFLTTIYQKQNQYQLKEAFYRQTLALKKQILAEKHLYRLLPIDNLTIFHSIKGRYEHAEELYKQTLSLNKRILGARHPYTLIISTNLAMIYQLQGKYQQAEELYKQTLALNKQVLGDNHPNTLSTINNLAELYHAQGLYQLAELFYKQSLALRKNILGDKHPDTFDSINNLAELYRDKGQYQLAESLYKQVLVLRKERLGKFHPDIFISISSLAYFYVSVERWDDAKFFLQEGLRFSNETLEQLLWGASKKTQLSYIKRENIYKNMYLSFYSFRNTPKEALYYSLSRKGLLLRISSEINTLSKKSSNPELKPDVEKLISLKNQLSAQAMLAFSGKSKKAIVDDLETQINDLEMELSQKVTGFKRSKTEVTPDEVQNKLKPNQALVDFLIYTEVDLKTQVYKKEQIIALVVDKNEIKLIKLGELALIKTTLKKYRKVLDQGVTKNDIVNKITQNKITKLAKKLYQQIWQPLTAHLQNKTNVYIIPDGILHLLPFKALQTENGDYLNSQYELTQLASARDIVLPPLKGESNAPAIFANPLYSEQAQTQTSNITSTRKREGLSFKRLDATKDEGKWLYDEMKKNQLSPKLYTLQHASEEQIKKLHAPKILHLATHGFYLEDNKIKPPKNNDSRSINTPQAIKLIDNPLTRSGLALSYANDGLQGKRENETTDGILTALEVLALDLEGTDLVVLSACETGLGEIKIGEGVYSLNRAFQEAGAKSVLSTLWNISDYGTQKFMEKFYQYYLTGTPAQQALQKTQQEFIQNPNFKHPYYWAGFVMTGIE